MHNYAQKKPFKDRLDRFLTIVHLFESFSTVMMPSPFTKPFF